VVVLVDRPGGGVTAGPGRPVLVSAGEGFHNAAALEVAVRIARSRSAEVRLVDVEPAGEADRVERSRRLASLAEEVHRVGPWCTPCLAPDGVTAEVTRQAPAAGLVTAGIDEDWFRGGGTFGPGTDELLAAVEAPVLVVRAAHGLTRAGVAGLVERIQGKGREDMEEVRSRLTAAGPESTHRVEEKGGQ
jgi:hypothetical protein